MVVLKGDSKLAHKSGVLSVPDEIRKLQPKGIPTLVKKIPSGKRYIYYVYEQTRIPDPKRPGKLKNGSGPCLGKIDPGSMTFIPNKKGLDRIPTDILSDSGVTPMQRLRYIDLETKDYGEYAMVLSCSSGVHRNLAAHFHQEDADLMYAMGVVYFVESYTPAGYFSDVFEQSVLSNKWPSAETSENSLSEFLKSIGRHGRTCELYSQENIDSGGELTAIDGHVVLSCSEFNDIADYGNKYAKIGGPQANLVEVFDVENNRPVACHAFDGGLLDKSSVAHMFEAYKFRGKTFLVDRGFYSETNLGLFRNGGNHFVTPVPDGTIIYSAASRHLEFSGAFTYDRADSRGKALNGTILYREFTVQELEEDEIMYREKKEDERYSQEYTLWEQGAADSDGRKIRKPRHRKTKQIERSAYAQDRVFLYRDEAVHAAMVCEYRAKIGSSPEYTEENLAEIEASFGVFVLRTDRIDRDAQATYTSYKKRWKIETHYNFLKNSVDFKGLHTQDYYVLQGLAFLALIVGQIQSAYIQRLKEAESTYVKNLSVKESLVKGAHIKIAKHQDNKWYITKPKKKTSELLEAMGVNIEAEIESLNKE